MAHSALAVLFLVVSSATADQSGARPQPASPVEQEVHGFMTELFGAMQKRDRAMLDRLVAEHFVFVHSTGDMDTRQVFLDKAAAGAQSSQTASPEYVDRQVHVYDGHTAVRITRSVRRGSGGTPDVSMRTLHVYAKVSGRWQWLSGQSTALGSRPQGVAIDPRGYDQYVGTYTIDTARNFTVTREGDMLKAQVTGRPQVELIPRSATEFATFNPESSVQAVVIFVRGDGDAVTHAVMRRDGKELWRAPRAR